MPRTYAMTAGDVLSKARIILNDTVATYRQSDTELIGHLNDALNGMVQAFPGLFSVDGTHTTTAGYMQQVINTRAVMFLECLGLPEGNAAALSQFKPGWMSDTQAATREFMRVPGDPLRFMVYPPAAASASLSIRFVQSPSKLTTTADVLQIPEVYEPALVDYVVGRSEMKDDEHANSGRAGQLMDRFLAGVKSLAAG